MKPLYFEAVLEIDPLNEVFELTTEIEDDFIIYAVAEENSELSLEVIEEEDYYLEIQDQDVLDFIVESGCAIVNYIDGEIYDGPYEVTPSPQEQRLFTTNRILLRDVVINPTQGLVDVSDTTATEPDVAIGKYFYSAEGIRVEGTYIIPSRATGRNF